MALVVWGCELSQPRSVWQNETMHRLAAVFILVVALHSPVWAQSDFHIISQVADGVFPDGTSYKTTFIIIPWFDAASPTCNIRFYGIQVHLGSETANSFTVNLPAGGSYYIQQTIADQELDTGYATVACDDDVFVQTFYSYYSADGAKLAEATVFSTEGESNFGTRFFVDGSEGALTGIAISNDSDLPRTYSITLRHSDGVNTGSISLSARTSRAAFLNEIIAYPAGASGVVEIESQDSVHFGAVALRVTGSVFTTIPAAPRRFAPNDDQAAVRGCPTGSPIWMGLPVCEESERVGYDRNAFGSGYSSLEDEIIRDLPKSGGQVYTPYMCALYAIRDDGTAATDIEHIIALAEAYDSGLPEARFRAFAGDLDNLTIAVPAVNRDQKSDRDAGEWAPPENRGWFASRVVAVKQKYSLSVDPTERDALDNMLFSDPSREVTCGGSTQPEPEPDPDSPTVWLARCDTNGNGRVTCIEATACGAPIPVTSDHPLYQYMTDGDGDGQVCE